jgi:hypothetical protein
MKGREVGDNHRLGFASTNTDRALLVEAERLWTSELERLGFVHGRK